MGGTMSEELTLEKMKIDARLKVVENHMKTGEENRQTLIKGFEDLKASVKSIESTLFGAKGQDGLVHQIEAFLKVANGIKTILTRIFVSICSAMAFAAMPSILKFMSQVLAKHIGG